MQAFDEKAQEEGGGDDEAINIFQEFFSLSFLWNIVYCYY